MACASAACLADGWNPAFTGVIRDRMAGDRRCSGRLGTLAIADPQPFPLPDRFYTAGSGSRIRLLAGAKLMLSRVIGGRGAAEFCRQYDHRSAG